MEFPGRGNGAGGIAEEISGRIHGFIADRESGIPAMRSQLRSAGFILDIGVTVTLEKDALLETISNNGLDFPEYEAPPKPSREEAEAAKEMGFTAEEITDMETEMRRSTGEILAGRIREEAPRLSPKVRYWICGFLTDDFPELGLVLPEASEGNPQPLEDDGEWAAKVEEIIARSGALANGAHVLKLVLANMIRLRTY